MDFPAGGSQHRAVAIAYGRESAVSQFPLSRSRSVVRRIAALAVVVLAVSAAAPATGGVPAAQPRSAPRVRYVALGDSEASAPGVPRQIDARCLRSSHDYPALVAARLRPESFTDRTCSSVTTADLARTQLSALRSDTTLVTLTVGADDIGFGRVMTACSLLGLIESTGSPCRKHYGGRIEQWITATGPKVGAVLRSIHRISPRAHVLLVGYLNLIPDNHRGCRPRELFAAGDLAYLDAAENTVNAMLARTAEAQNGHFVDFVDNQPVSAAHDICRPDGTRWTEALLPNQPSAPFHPNESGEAAMAGQVLAALTR